MSGTDRRDNDRYYKESLIKLEAKVDLLVRELIEGDKNIGRDGYVKRTEARLSELEDKIGAQLSREQVRLVAKTIDLAASYRFVFGMLATSILALAGLVSIILQGIKLLRGG